MYLLVRLLKGFPEPLWYQTPSHWDTPPLIGSVIKVPLKNNVFPAIVEELHPQKPSSLSFTIREAISIEPFPCDKSYTHYLKKLSKYYCIDSLFFIKRLRHFLEQKGTVKAPEIIDVMPQKLPITNLTIEQQNAYQAIKNDLKSAIFSPTLLHGVTGSGKTEIYKNIIFDTLSANKTVIFLVPEITLALQFEKIFHQHISNHFPVIGFHSATTNGEKKQLWQNLLHKKAQLIVGVHLPILLPITNLGLIIVDEEHEVNYQEKKHPKINSKEAALLRAQIAHIPIVLGSATPSVTSFYQVQQKRWKLCTLTKRFAGNFPKIEPVILKEDRKRKNFWISYRLEKAIEQCLKKKEQVILFLNRRGYSFFVQCKECSYVFACPNCSVSLTLHEKNLLRCHYCDFHQELPIQCPSCKTPDKNFLKKGIGTQQVVSILASLFPAAKIARADLDTTTKKKQWMETVKQFQQGNIDILVGTQTITKGYHFPRVTLVGILWADLNLHFPLYHAVETTLHQLIQVAGRAGRQSVESLVIIQAMSDHPVFSFTQEDRYLSFVHQEIQKRKEVSYPPFIRLAEIEVKYKNEDILDQESYLLVKELLDLLKIKNINAAVLGPSVPPLYKIKNWYSRKIYIKSPSIHNLTFLFQSLDQKKYQSSIFFTPNPLSM